MKIFLTSLATGAIVLAIVIALQFTIWNNKASDNNVKLEEIYTRIDSLEHQARTPKNQAVTQVNATPTRALNRTAPSTAATPLFKPTTVPVTATAVPTPILLDGPGICGRTPIIQNWILDRLKINSCEVITQGEMFRIEDNLEMRYHRSPKAGDFAGLVNILEVELYLAEGSGLSADTFNGMTGVRNLRVRIEGGEEGNGSVEAGAFRGLTDLETLELEW